jgi:hypothetical protein
MKASRECDPFPAVTLTTGVADGAFNANLTWTDDLPSARDHRVTTQAV